MSDDGKYQAAAAMPAAASLPVEANSSAEILAATHLFSVEVLEASGSTWTTGPDGLEHRRLRLRFRLLEQLKGHLILHLGSTFELEVPQKREDALNVSDYHGFWSHQGVEQGSRYLVVAAGTNDTPAVLMQEPAIRALLDAGLVADVKLAVQAEQRFSPALQPTQRLAQREAAATDLLRFTRDHRATCKGLYGRYAWARLAPIYPQAEHELLPAVLGLIESRDATVELREAVLYGLYGGTAELEPTQERTTRLVHSFLGLLLQPEAAPLHDRLLQVPLYNLIRGPNACPAATVVVPDSEERARLRQAVGHFGSPRAKEVGAWLDVR